MATFKTQLPSSPTLVSAYRGKTVVYLEGETDVTLFRNYWFKERLDKIEFREPENGIGCPGVLKEVPAYRQETGLPAFGIIDRDKLHADMKWEGVWETDDEKFSRTRPYGEHIRVTRNWEIESYLVHPEAVEEHAALCNKGRANRPKEIIEEECLTHAEALIPHAALNSALRAHGKSEWGDGATSKFENRAAVEAHFHQKFNSGDIDPIIWQTYEKNLPKVEAFASGVTPIAKFQGLLRRINGKALLHRIKEAHKLRDDPTFIFANTIRRMNAIPQELVAYIDEFSGA